MQFGYREKSRREKREEKMRSREISKKYGINIGQKDESSTDDDQIDEESDIEEEEEKD